jgi:hypothetical protein
MKGWLSIVDRLSGDDVATDDDLLLIEMDENSIIVNSRRQYNRTEGSGAVEWLQ